MKYPKMKYETISQAIYRTNSYCNTNSHVSAQNIERVIIEDAKRLHTGSLQFLYNERIYRHILDVGDF